MRAGGGEKLYKELIINNLKIMLTSNYNPQTDKSPSPYDKTNCLLVCAVYHENKWNSPKGLTNATYHSLKYLNENVEYLNADENQRYAIEFGRVVRIMRTKFTGAFKDNYVKTLQVMLNHNKGNKQSTVQNPPILKVVFDKNIIIEVNIYIDDQYWNDFATSIVDQIEQEMLKAISR